ncbi:hypothetical protein I6F36_35405 [Bradyrhizobium sp. BRP19]|uniref:hypothetical protein n=1 Tax=Bradyrhizobium sp. BRP19 TaxID=2793823 RepID=UPI001CD666CE|nr:hypothetical protein [Bradyrhizobium sp. BRP19]MCA1552081.1 hypothetical protein [Bradyrhizobium sp. BRP19]
MQKRLGSDRRAFGQFFGCFQNPGAQVGHGSRSGVRNIRELLTQIYWISLFPAGRFPASSLPAHRARSHFRENYPEEERAAKMNRKRVNT